MAATRKWFPGQVTKCGDISNTSSKYDSRLNEAKTLELQEIEVLNIRLKQEIEKRKKAEEVLEAFFKPTTSLVVILDRNYNIIRVNDAFAKACSCNVSDFPGHNYFEFYPSDAKEIFDKVIGTKDSDKRFARPFVFPNHPERGVTYWDWKLIPVLGSSGEVDLLVFIQNDVTEYVRIKEKLRESEERYYAIFNNSLNGVLLTLPDGTILSANPSACRMFGRTEEEICAVGINGIFDLDDPRLMRAGKEREQTGSFSSEMTLIRKDGTKFPCLVTSNLFKDKDGRILSSTIIHDITDSKKAEEALRLSEDNFYKAFNTTNPLSMAIVSLESVKYVDVNEAFIKRYGFSRDELIGFRLADIGFCTNLKEYNNFLQEIKQKGFANNFEVGFRKKTGELLTVLMYGVAINFTGEECILSISNDITELRRYKNEIARLDSLNLIGEMAAGIGHEIRNPMTTVRGFLQLFKKKDRYAQDKKYMDLMIGELDRANAIITEFLSMAKNKAIKLKSQCLNQELRALCPLLQADATKRDIGIKLELGDIPYIIIDKNEIQQLILNLVRNGLEAMSPGGSITIKTFKNGDKVILAVQDQGEGIAPEVLEKIGTPFFTTKDYGTGLGLAVCYSIAQRHNARIDIETGSHGTTFYVRFNA